jgi:hypothetical protein
MVSMSLLNTLISLEEEHVSPHPEGGTAPAVSWHQGTWLE